MGVLTEAIQYEEVVGFENLDRERYHADGANSVSHSELEVFRDSPELYEGRFLLNKWPQEVTDAMKIGTVFHEMVLENNCSFKIIPEDVLSKSGSKAGGAWKDWEQENAGYIHLKSHEVEDFKHMADAIRRHDAAARLLHDLDGQPEYSIFWNDTEHGLRRRCRIDRLLTDFIVDIKTCADATPRALASLVYSMGYHRQCCFYRDAVRAIRGETLPFVLVFVKKTPPYTVETFELNDEFIALGDSENAYDLERFGHCRDTGVWESESYGTLRSLSAPAWAKFETEWR